MADGLDTLPPVTPSRWSTALLALLLGHLAWGLLRLPTRVVPRRLHEIEAYQRLGAAPFLFADADLQGAAAIAWLCTHTAPDQRIAWRGVDRGAIEFAAALVWPRLLVRAQAAPGGGDDALLEATPTALAIRR